MARAPCFLLIFDLLVLVHIYALQILREFSESGYIVGKVLLNTLRLTQKGIEIFKAMC